uniref:Uncharacterized protein n=1 Tax=Arundo donax TaxID=35708 RepID=A0A0A9DBH0_ARUDO
MQEKTSPDALRAEVRVAVRGRQGLDLATSSLDPMSGSTTSALTPPDHDLHAINQPLTQNLQRGGGLVQGVRRCGKKRAVGAVPSARAASPISHGRRQAIEGVHEPRPPWRMDPRMSPRRTVLWMHHQLASLPKPQRRARVVIIQQVRHHGAPSSISTNPHLPQRCLKSVQVHSHGYAEIIPHTNIE